MLYYADFLIDVLAFVFSDALFLAVDDDDVFLAVSTCTCTETFLSSLAKPVLPFVVLSATHVNYYR